MVSLSQIFDWFKTGKTPTEQQFRDTWQSFWHKSEKIPSSKIEDDYMLIDNPGSSIILSSTATVVRVKCAAGGVYNISLHPDRAPLSDVYVIFTNETVSPATVRIDAAYLSASAGYEFEIPAIGGAKPGVFELNLFKDAEGTVFFLTS
ncbi:MAG: hypothetical protein LBL33_08720 [Tannerella sp.]|jgi:hypothetical protein|nr:hypothetical protein [Tannerella sp.]